MEKGDTASALSCVAEKSLNLDDEDDDDEFLQDNISDTDSDIEEKSRDFVR